MNPDEIHRYSFSIDPALFSAAFTKSGKLLIGTEENLMVCKIGKDSVSVIKVLEGFDSHSVTTIHKTADASRFFLGTDGNGLYQLIITDKGYDLIRIPDHPELVQFSSISRITMKR